MQIELRRFFENDDIKQDFDYEFTCDDKLFSEPVHVKGFVKNSTGIVSLTAEADFTISAQCAKCAKNICKNMSIPVSHLLVSKLNDEDNDDFILVENMLLDLDGLVMEDIYLSLPLRFLCKEDCKGLCPYCGKDLNDGECGCKKPVDPRLAALSQLLSKDE